MSEKRVASVGEKHREEMVDQSFVRRGVSRVCWFTLASTRSRLAALGRKKVYRAWPMDARVWMEGR